MDQVEEISNAKLAINSYSLPTALKVMKINELKSIFTFLCITLQIAVTLPITGMIPEKTFFKLTIVKNRFHSIISGDRFEHLMTLYYI